MKHFLLTYTLAADYLERRSGSRAEHLELALAAVARGELLLGGAVAGDPPVEAQLLFVGDSPHEAEAFARGDPYVTNGLVEAWRVREWITVVGPDAAQPLAAV